MLIARRLGLALLGYIAGCLAAGLLIAVVLGAFVEGVGLGASLAIGSYICGFALGPAAIVIAAGEWLRWRSILVWIGAGMAIGVFALLVLGRFTPGISEHRPYLFVISGIVWGAVYWLIAGRSAGGRLEAAK